MIVPNGGAVCLPILLQDPLASTRQQAHLPPRPSWSTSCDISRESKEATTSATTIPREGASEVHLGPNCYKKTAPSLFPRDAGNSFLCPCWSPQTSNQPPVRLSPISIPPKAERPLKPEEIKGWGNSGFRPQSHLFGPETTQTQQPGLR